MSTTEELIILGKQTFFQNAKEEIPQGRICFILFKFSGWDTIIYPENLQAQIDKFKEGIKKGLGETYGLESVQIDTMLCEIERYF